MANRELSFSLGIPANPVTAFADPDIATEFLRIYLALNSVAFKLDEYTNALDLDVTERAYYLPAMYNRTRFTERIYVKANVDLPANSLVAFDSTGALLAVSGTNKARGIVLQDTATGNYAPIALRGVIPNFIALVPGSTYYLSTTPGVITAVQPSTVQRIGYALPSGSELYFNPEL